MKTTQKQSGSAHVIIIVVLAVVVVGLLGFVFWQNFINKPTVANTTQATNKTSGDPVKETDTTTNQTEAVSSKQIDGAYYTVLADWGVKFADPVYGIAIQAAFITDNNNAIGFTTSNLTLDDMCNAAKGAAGMVERSKTKQTVPTTGSKGTLLNDGKPINGYYYMFTLPNGQHCSNTSPSDYDEAVRMQGFLQTLSAE